MSVISSIFGRPSTLASDLVVEESFRLDRTEQLTTFERALQSRQHVLVYGLPRQGKTTLVRTALGDKPMVMIHANGRMTFEDIFRAFLMTTGCSVVVEKKKRREVTSKAEIQLPWTVKAAGEGTVSGEYTLRTFTADIHNPNDVAFLLGEIPNTPALVIDRFELLNKETRQVLLSALVLFSELKVLRVVLISSEGENPLHYHEKVPLDRHLAYVHVPPLSIGEVSQLVRHFGSKAGGDEGLLDIARYIHDTFGGSVDLCISAAELAAKGEFARGTRGVEDLSNAVHERMSNQLLQFLAAVFEKNWYVGYVQMLDDEEPAGSDEPVEFSGRGARHDLTLLVPYLRSGVATPAEEDAVFKALRTASLSFAAKLCSSPYRSGSAEYLASALAHFLRHPAEGHERIVYVPASLGADSTYVHIGTVICQMLVDARLDKRVSLKFADLSRFGLKRKLVIAKEFGPDSFRRILKKLARLQSRSRILPEPFVFGEDQASIWLPQNNATYGDVRPAIRAFLHEREQAELDDDDGVSDSD